MKVGVPKEIAEGERRVGIVPETVAKLVKDGFEVLVETGAGRDYNLDENYEDAGARVVDGVGEIYGEADLVVKVARPTEDEIGKMHEGLVLVCFINGPQNAEVVKALADAGVTVFSNEAIPRTSVAQAMDALSSMGSIAGYKTALIAANNLGKYVPMLSTAAGTTKAAKVMIFGVAVAGLQAIAIMNRLGGEVFAYDIRPETKEQAQSLGATFIDSEDEKEEDGQEDEYEEYRPTGFRKFMASLGFYSFAEPPRDEYIVEGEEEDEEDEDEEEDEGWSKEKLEEDQKLIRERMKEMDIVITTALVPGRKAPQLVDKAMVESMKPGSVVVDLAAESGGNCELTEPGEVVEHQEVRILGPVNLPSEMPIHASQLLSRNMYNLIGHITEDQAEEKDEKDVTLALDFEDEIIDKTCIAHDGEVRHEPTREALENASKESEAR
ncbi:NAD(P)(+) transhydrogenase (Re/Si-specific) subunit alpha [Rubrobacter marinus]|uniref:proton-translocating NAD(P)(+) transhydrogenase n=1 Tax=Rubrobacter marinus TaxID=2653852 RepID=A0A6G8PUW7_9ACTN|nr:NAD(P) transhydrogenase subunit alpha [Rubrobacter marinus]QIN77785.1 NAD(P)(+) transhydrogenase (Re/Si-specific) subunit alpha [Rubrobacter marinus]